MSPYKALIRRITAARSIKLKQIDYIDLPVPVNNFIFYEQ